MEGHADQLPRRGSGSTSARWAPSGAGPAITRSAPGSSYVHTRSNAAMTRSAPPSGPSDPIQTSGPDPRGWVLRFAQGVELTSECGELVGDVVEPALHLGRRGIVEDIDDRGEASMHRSGELVELRAEVGEVMRDRLADDSVDRAAAGHLRGRRHVGDAEVAGRRHLIERGGERCGVAASLLHPLPLVGERPFERRISRIEILSAGSRSDIGGQRRCEALGEPAVAVDDCGPPVLLGISGPRGGHLLAQPMVDEQPVELGLEHGVVVERGPPPERMTCSTVSPHRAFTSTGTPASHDSNNTSETTRMRTARPRASRRGAASTSSHRRPHRPRRCRDARAPPAARSDDRDARAGWGCAPCSERRATRAGGCPCCDRPSRDTRDRAATRAPAHHCRAAGDRSLVDAEPDHHLRLGHERREPRFGDRPLPLGVEGDAPRRLEHVVEEREADRGLVVRGGMHHRVVADEGQADDGRVVQVRRECEEVVIARPDRCR